MLAEYSGWTGNDGGPPGEQTMRHDALLYADWVLKEYPAHPLVAWGDSIGTGVVIEMAARRPVMAVVLDSPYTSVLEIARRNYLWLPVKLLFRHPFDSMAILPLVKAPIAVVHGESDPIIPPDMGHTVWNNAQVKGPGIFIPNSLHLPTLGLDVGRHAVK